VDPQDTIAVIAILMVAVIALRACSDDKDEK